MIRTYTELARLDDFKARFRYLVLGGGVGSATFGYDRYLNQRFYRSNEWSQIRSHVISRDNGCDLAVPGYEIYDRIYIHHMNPMTPEDILKHDEAILNPEYLISTTLTTHNAIHYGGEKALRDPYVERKPNDTRLW